MHATHSCFPSILSGRRVRCARRSRRFNSRRSFGFSLTELLVVIGIIVLLIGLLLVALKQVKVKSNRTRTESTMNQFSNACTAFESENGFYPGVIPDEVLAAANPCPISGTENVLLHLVGGYRVWPPSDPPGGPVATDFNQFVQLDPANVKQVDFITPAGVWKLAFYPERMKDGPVINGKPHAPYFTAGANDLGLIVRADPGDPNSGQVGEPPVPNHPEGGYMNDLLEAWENPIIFVKRTRSGGPLLQDVPPLAGAPLPQFTRAASGVKNLVGTDSYLQTTGKSQSIFHADTGLSDTQRGKAWAAILGTPAFYNKNEPLFGTARGAFMLLSAGPDGIFFSRNDGPGTETVPLGPGNVDSLILNNPSGAAPKIMDQFDDIRVFGGG